MKKVFAVLLAAVIIVSIFIIPGYAEEEFINSIDKVTSVNCLDEGKGDVLRIDINPLYRTYGENLSVIVYTKVNYEEEYDCDVYNIEDLEITFEGEEGKQHMVIYVPDAVNKHYFEEVYVRSGSLYDEDGKSNFYAGHTSYVNETSMTSWRVGCQTFDPYYVGQTVDYKFAYPVDFYCDGNLAAENVTEWSYLITEEGEHEVCAKKFDRTIGKDRFNAGTLVEKSKFEQAGETVGDTIMGFFGTLSLMPLAGPAFFFNPLLSYAMILGPFVTVYYGIQNLLDLI